METKNNDNPEELAYQFRHIKGWGIDADPENEPTYPMKNYTGDDHNRLNYVRPYQQPVNVEILHSNERPSVSATFGTAAPPSGLSGIIRRYAFRHSEESLRHWFPLVLADRINVVEGIIDDIAHGHIPNIFAEMGWKAEWEHNPKRLVKRVAVGLVVTSVIIGLLYSRNKKLKKA